MLNYLDYLFSLIKTLSCRAIARHYTTTALGILTSSPISLTCALAARIEYDNEYDNASDLRQAIYSLEAQGNTDTSVFRYSHSNGVIKIWDSESGQLLYSSSGH